MQLSRHDLVEIVCEASSLTERLEAKLLLTGEQKKAGIINHKIKDWSHIAAQGDLECFEKRLSWDRLDVKAICFAMSTMYSRDAQRLPSWAETFSQLITAVSAESVESALTCEERFLHSEEPFPFEEVLVPFIHVARRRLVTLAESSYQLLSNQAHATFERDLTAGLGEMCAQAMELEFSTFRTGGHFGVLRLLRETPNSHSNDIYKRFIKYMFEGGLAQFFRKYPVLARLVATVTDAWVEATGEFLFRLQADWSDLHRTFRIASELGQVTAVKPNLSDPHNTRRSVIAVTFASGFKLIYKPKNIDLERTYFKLLDWFNQHDIPLPFKLLTVLTRSTYGWVEFVDALPCTDYNEAKRYHQRAGTLLCLAYVLEATDLHLQNIIACGEYPVLIDMETLMHHRVRPIEEENKGEGAQYLADQQLLESVLRTGLLPRWELRPRGKSYDGAGLCDNGEEELPLRIPVWSNINRDGMTLKYEYAKAQGQANVPSLNGSSLPLKNYVGEIIDGFAQMYRFLMENRETILLQSPLTELAHQPVRFIFRPTQVYRYVLHKILHPRFLRDGVDQSMQLDVLSRAMLSTKEKHPFWPLLRIEQQSLEQMDIPLFTAFSDDDSFQVAPNQVIKKCFLSPSYDLVVSRLARLDIEDKDRQISFIRGSLYSRIASATQIETPFKSINSHSNVTTPVDIDREEIINQAINIAVHIQEQAIQSSDGSATWITPQYITEAQRYQLQPMGYSLYDGCCGVALFLAAVERVKSGAGFRETALAALQSLRQSIQSSEFPCVADSIGIGGAAGVGSIVYGLVRTSQLLGEPALLEDATRVSTFITPTAIAADTNFDVVSGAAGAILGLLALYNHAADQNILERAVTCGSQLLNNRVVSDAGYRTWSTFDGNLLTGFSHGAAGIAYSLLRLYKVTNEPDFLEAASEAFAYERSVFNAEVGNWPDFRAPLEDDWDYMCTWCHGAPGIGLARIAGIGVLDSSEISREIDAAIGTTLRHKTTDIDHLCCGNLGRIEFLFTTARSRSQPELLKTVMAQASQVVGNAKERGSFGFSPFLTWTPSFFQGAAGIGYELLRLSFPELLPSVLVWE